MPSLSVRCPRCQAVFKVDAALAGQSTHCAKCGQAMLVPSPAAPPVVSAPPVASAPPAIPTTPRVAVVAEAPKSKAAPAAPVVRRELSPKEKAKLAFRANLIMLALGVIVLTMTMLVLLYLTGERPPF